MRTSALITACVAALALAGCETMTTEERMIVGGLTGAAAGLLTANMINANPQWTVLATLAGATAGALVARNTATQQCAYAKGDGTYYTAPCP